jgi:hypothetical protein
MMPGFSDRASQSPHSPARRDADVRECPFFQKRPVLHIKESTHQATTLSKRLLQDVGGLPKLVEMTTCFYEKMFRNPHLEPFFLRTEVSLHALRLAQWVAEKMGDRERPWTLARQARVFGEHGQPAQPILNPVVNGTKPDPRSFGLRTPITDGFEVFPDFAVRVRSSAHFASWHCLKRNEPRVLRMGTHNLGDHFKLDDCRAWMRLHFWACREVGLFPGGSGAVEGIASPGSPCSSPQASLQLEFQNWYERFIGHFVRIYAREAPFFARLESQWSDQRSVVGRANVANYLAVQAAPGYFEEGKHGMDDVIGLRDFHAASRAAGLTTLGDGWPYSDSGEFVRECGDDC